MPFPSWLTWYKKPEYRDIKEYSNAVSSGRRPLSPDGRGKTSIPSRLRLERVLENKTCSPMSLYDFYMYLKYIERSPENLEFYIWYQNYARDWAKNGADKDDSSFDSASASNASIEKSGDIPDFSYDPEVAKETLEQISNLISTQALCTSKKCSPGDACAMPTVKRTQSSLNLVGSGRSNRGQLNAVIKTFLVPGSEKELNIPPHMRTTALSELEHSSDPAHLKPIAEHVYQLLRNCSHRNFVRLGVSNGTYETLCVATTLGIVLTIAGFLLMFLRAFVPFRGAHSRWDAFAAWPMWWLGMSLILSGLRGSCFFLLLFSRRQPLPWERFDDNASIVERTGIMKILGRLMIFDRKVKVNDDHLRRLQHKIVLQSMFFGALFSTIGCLVFVFLPVWRQNANGGLGTA